MRQYKLFDKIDQTESYSSEYKEKLKDTYLFFKENGYEFTQHALGRVIGQKTGQGKREFTRDEVLEVLKNKPNYTQDEGKSVKFYNNLAVIQANDTDEIVSIVVRNKVRPGWKEVK
jgi:uncharacterized protein (UPF0297 family)